MSTITARTGLNVRREPTEHGEKSPRVGASSRNALAHTRLAAGARCVGGANPGTRWGLLDVITGQEDTGSTDREDFMAGMVRKLIASGIAAKVIQEARKPENQAKIKQFIADFQQKRAQQGRRPGGTTRY
jgi:hypothetical protein